MTGQAVGQQRYSCFALHPRSSFVLLDLTRANSPADAGRVGPPPSLVRYLVKVEFVKVYAASSRRIHIANITGFASRRVTRVLDEVIAQRGRPLAILCNNGPELSPRPALPGLGGRVADRSAPYSIRGKAGHRTPIGELPRAAQGCVPAGELLEQPVCCMSLGNRVG